MKVIEKRQMELKLEIERLKNYHGSAITSSVLSGTNMQYKVTDYRAKVEKAFDEVLREVTKLKFGIIEGENRRHDIKMELEHTENQRKERMATFLEFDLKYQKTLKAIDNLKDNDNTGRLLTWSFKELKRNMKRRKGERKRLTDLFMNWLLRYKKAAFMRWKTGDFVVSSRDTQGFISVGSVMLQQSVEKRKELQGLLREAISNTTTIKQKLTLVGEFFVIIDMAVGDCFSNVPPLPLHMHF